MAPPAAALAPPKVPFFPYSLHLSNPLQTSRTTPSPPLNSRNTTARTPPSRSTWPSRAPCLMFPRNGQCMVRAPGIMCLRARMGVLDWVSLSFCCLDGCFFVARGLFVRNRRARYGGGFGGLSVQGMSRRGDPRDALVTYLLACVFWLCGGPDGLRTRLCDAQMSRPKDGGPVVFPASRRPARPDQGEMYRRCALLCTRWGFPIRF